MPTLLVVSTEAHAPVHVCLGSLRNWVMFPREEIGRDTWWKRKLLHLALACVTPSTTHYTHIKYSSRVPTRPRTFGNWGIV